MRHPAVLLACAIVAGCGAASPTSPSQQGGLRLTASITSGSIAPGQTAIITFRLENSGSQRVTLHFGDSCQLNPFIRNASSEIVYPPHGGWVCLTVLTDLTLEPQATKTVDVTVGGMGQALNSYVPLPAGVYSAYATVPSGEYKLQSDPIVFTIK